MACRAIWRAGHIDHRSGGIAVGETLDAILEHVAADADALDCAEQMEHCRAIILEELRPMFS